MSEGTYRNDLAAAQMRGAALETELAAAQTRIRNLEGNTSDKLQGLIAAGIIEDQRALKKVQRTKAKEQRSAERWNRRKHQWDTWCSGRRSRRSMSAIPIGASWLLPIIVTSIMLPFLAVFIIFETPRIMLGYLFIALAALYAASVPWGWLAMYRERQRIDDLPFEVTGHISALGNSLRVPKLCIEFRDEVPSVQAAQALVLGLTKRSHNLLTMIALRSTVVETEGKELRFHSDAIETSWFSDNRHYLLWYRNLVEAGAVALHQSYPVQSIRIEWKQ